MEKITIEWFWSNVGVTPTNQECWLWRKQRYANGYGRVNCGAKQFLAHRIAYGLAHGPIPDGLNVLHKCDVPLCVNPAHLFVGTQTDNMQDCAKKGRLSPYAREGAKNPKAKLTADDVREIRRRRRECGDTLQKLSDEYGVAPAHLSLIVRRKAWTHI